MGKWEHKNIEYVLPEEIEKRSFAIIARNWQSGASPAREQDMITRRVIHTSAVLIMHSRGSHSEKSGDAKTY